MQITIIGALVVLLGIWCQFGRPRRVIISVFALTILGAASALDLPALGGASVTPSSLFLVFFLLRLVGRQGGLRRLLDEMGPRRPLFPFLLLSLWIAVTAILLPRLFEGATDVYSLARSLDNEPGTTPLHPTSGNISQAVYALGGFLMAAATCAFARRSDATRALLAAIAAASLLDIGFALLDLVTTATHTGFLLDIVHTGGYAFLTEDQLGGLKRVSGSFSEASSFAAYSLTLFAVNFALFVQGVRPRLTGAASLILAGLVVLSTSSAGYAGLGVFIAAFLAYAILVGLALKRRRVALVAAGLVGGAVVLVGLVVLFLPGIAATAQDVLTNSLLNKAATESALERGAWNAQAWQVFLDTHGVGAGIGATRASNYALVLLSNLGLLGFVLFATTLGLVVLRRLSNQLDFETHSIVWAARIGILTTLVPSLLVGTVFDLGTLFYGLVGIAASGVALPRSARVAGETFMRQPSHRPAATFAK